MIQQLPIRIIGLVSVLLAMVCNLYVPAEACSSSMMQSCCAMAVESSQQDMPPCCQQQCHKLPDDNSAPQPKFKLPSSELFSTVPRKTILTERLFDLELTRLEAIEAAKNAASQQYRPDKIYLLNRCLLI